MRIIKLHAMYLSSVIFVFAYRSYRIKKKAGMQSVIKIVIIAFSIIPEQLKIKYVYRKGFKSSMHPFLSLYIDNLLLK